MRQRKCIEKPTIKPSNRNPNNWEWQWELPFKQQKKILFMKLVERGEDKGNQWREAEIKEILGREEEEGKRKFGLWS